MADRSLNVQNRTVSQLFVKGVVNQEEQQEVPVPALLHCVFCGARGLFTDSLIRNTSAQIVVSGFGVCVVQAQIRSPVPSEALSRFRSDDNDLCAVCVVMWASNL